MQVLPMLPVTPASPPCGHSYTPFIFFLETECFLNFPLHTASFSCPHPGGRRKALRFCLPHRPAKRDPSALPLRVRGPAQQRPAHLRGVGCSSGARLGGGSSAGRGGAERCGSLGGAGGVRARSHPGVHRGRGWDPAYKLQQRRAVSHLNVSQLRSPLQAPPDHWTSASAPFNTSINFH